MAGKRVAQELTGQPTSWKGHVPGSVKDRVSKNKMKRNKGDHPVLTSVLNTAHTHADRKNIKNRKEGGREGEVARREDKKRSEEGGERGKRVYTQVNQPGYFCLLNVRS